MDDFINIRPVGHFCSDVRESRSVGPSIWTRYHIDSIANSGRRRFGTSTPQGDFRKAYYFNSKEDHPHLATMKEAIVKKDLTVEIVDSPIPQPGPDQVVIKVIASGSNPKDWCVTVTITYPAKQLCPLKGWRFNAGLT